LPCYSSLKGGIEVARRSIITTYPSYFNEYYMSGQNDEVKQNYWEKITPETHSSNCISCGICEEQCPQELPIRKFMGETTRIFSKTH